MTASRRNRWWERTTPARQGAPPAPGHATPAHAEPATARARQQRIVTATGIGGAGLLGISLSTKAGSAQFYLLTMGLAGTWAAGALSSGPVPLGPAQGPEGAHRRPVVMPVLTGAGAFGLFYGAARLARHVPPLNRAIGSLLHYADDGSTGLVLLTACANAVAEELFFRGGLWSLVQDSHPLAKTTLAYAAATAATRNPALVLAGTANQRALRPPAPHLRRHPGLGPHPPHMVAPHAALPPAPVPDAPAGRDHPGLTAWAAWQMAADSAPAPHRTRRSARGSPWILLSFQPRRVGDLR